MFFKSIIALSITLLLTSCVSNSLNYNNKKSSINLTINNKEKVITLTNPKFVNTFSVCSLDTYTLSDENSEYGRLFLENIALEGNCQWNGAASGFFVYELRTKLKFKTFKLVDRFIQKNYEISTYKVDGDKYVSIIEMYSVNSNSFIIDNKGKLSTEIIKALDPEFKFKYTDAPRTDIKYDFSLVQNNIFKGYFTKESERIDDIK